MVLPLRVWLNGQGGEAPSAQLAHTIDISPIGCRLGGLRERPFPGQTIALQRGQHKAAFRVVWSSQLAANENQAGIEALDYGRNIWGVELPPAPFAPKTSNAAVQNVVVSPSPSPSSSSSPARVQQSNASFPKVLPSAYLNWKFGMGLLVLAVFGGWSLHQVVSGGNRIEIYARIPGPPSSKDLAPPKLKPRAESALLTKTLDSSTARLQVGEAPVGHVVYPVAPDGSSKGKVSLQIIVAANGVVKQIRAVGGAQSLAEAAARAVRLWRYRPITGGEQIAQRETSVVVNFVGGDVVSLQFPSSNGLRN
jgi:hypothetical protein